jgi:hypothetical protein
VTRLRILAWIYILPCALLLAAGTIVLVGLAMRPAANRAALSFIGFPFLFASVLGLRPWARVLILVPSAILLPMLPVGTAIGVFALWTLLDPSVSALFGGSLGEAFHRPSSPTVNLLVVIACVGAGFFLVIRTGFAIHHEPPPSPLDDNGLAITAGMVPFVGIAASIVRVIQSRHWQGGPAATPQTLFAPQTASVWSMPGTPYVPDTGQPPTCEHLVAIERGLRAGGVSLPVYAGGAVTAACRIDPDGLRYAYDL